MPTILIQEDLDYAKSLLDQGKIVEMYEYFSSKGYQYAELANGVAQGNSVSGLMALEYIENTAEDAGITLTETDVNDIRLDMAQGYFDTLSSQLANSPDGTIVRDISYDEAWGFHSEIFERRGLGADAWTLNTVFNLMPEDGEARTAYWDDVLNSAGDPAQELGLALGTLYLMHFQIVDEQAQSWLDRMVLPDSWGDFLGALGIQWDLFAEELGQQVFDTTDSAFAAAMVESANKLFSSMLFAGSFGLDLLTDSGINVDVLSQFLNGRNWTPPIRRDPLDLDGDGIETFPADGSVLFDHTADGVKQATGWVAPDDGLLVLDRDGNGTIDNGRELFGDSTLLADGTAAEDGFAALADLDDNADGQIDASDSAFSDLRVWRDLNSDGISQVGELLALSELGIQSISTQGTVDGSNLGDGNVSAKTSTFTYTDGTTGNAGAGDGVSTGTTADLDLVENPFYREFTDTIAIPDELQDLPTMQGSGAVRDLLQAAALSPVLDGDLSCANDAEFLCTVKKIEMFNRETVTVSMKSEFKACA